MPVLLFLARPMIAAWLRLSPRSWERGVTATDSPHLHAPGVNADRVLLVGDGVATGRGVATHELGLAGHLARGLTALTGHATDVDIVVNTKMTVETAVAAITGVNLARFDTVVLSIGHNEALSLMSPDRWRAGLTDLLDAMEQRSPAARPVSILAVPAFGPKTAMPERLAEVVDRTASTLNRVTAEVIADRPNVTLVGAGLTILFEPETAKNYRRWADIVAAHVSGTLRCDRAPGRDAVAFDETERQLALRALEASESGASDSLEDLVASATHLFAAPIAAITFIHDDHQSFRAIQGAEAMNLPRDEVFCDVTIRRGSHLVVEDATADPRYAGFGVVTGAPAVRFYAGYPIESPDGHRVGALCVMDTKARQFTETDLTMLRSMALLAQERLWPAA